MKSCIRHTPKKLRGDKTAEERDPLPFGVTSHAAGKTKEHIGDDFVYRLPSPLVPHSSDLSPRPSHLKERGRKCGFRSIKALHNRRPGVWGVFPCLSVQRIRPGTPEGLPGHPNPMYASGVIHGKTGSLPKGALLFGPFSSAHKKKDVKERKQRIYEKKIWHANDIHVVCLFI